MGLRFRVLWRAVPLVTAGARGGSGAGGVMPRLSGGPALHSCDSHDSHDALPPATRSADQDATAASAGVGSR